MLWLILTPLIRVRRVLDRLLGLVLARAIAGALLAVVLLVLPSLRVDLTVVPGLIAAAYALAALAWLPHTLVRVRAARLEARLARQGFTDDALALCLGPDTNLWSKSLVVDTVRRVRALPTPGALRSAIWERRVALLAQQQFDTLRPTRFDPTVLILVGLALTWPMTGWGTITVGLAFALEAATHLTRAQAIQRVHALERALATALSGADTTLASPLIRPPHAHGYAHRRLYRTGGFQSDAS